MGMIVTLMDIYRYITEANFDTLIVEIISGIVSISSLWFAYWASRNAKHSRGAAEKASERVEKNRYIIKEFIERDQGCCNHPHLDDHRRELSEIVARLSRME